MHPLISIIIPYYNGEKYIQECLDSAFQQTYPNIEIVLVNDGSEQNYLNNLIKEKYSSVTLHHQENKGQSAARNMGVNLSNGDLIFFLDCDDKLDSTALEKLYKQLNRDSSLKIVYSKGRTFEAIEGSWNLPEFNLDAFLFNNCIPIGCLIYKEDFVRQGGFDTNLTFFEDWDLWMAIIKNGGKVARVDEELYFYRIRNDHNSLTNIKNEEENMSGLNKLYIYKKHYDFYSENGYNFDNICEIILNKDFYKKKYFNTWYRKITYKYFKPKKYKEIYPSM